MDVYPVIIFLGHVCRIESLCLERILSHDAGCHRFFNLCIKLCDRTDAFCFLAVFGLPYRKRCSPVTAAAEVPVLDILKPLSETSCTGRFRLPCDGLVELHHPLTHSRGPDEPGVERIVKHRFVGTPAMRIVMSMFFDSERLVLLLEHHTDVHIKRRSIFRQFRIICVLHIAACPF